MTKIMLVEDDNNLREIYEARLSAEGYEIVSAENGEVALAMAAKERPDMIISDVMMPKISGFEMLDILRNTDSLKNVKIIMLTALGQAEDSQRANSLGADRYLVKSQVTLEDIVKATHDLLDDPTKLANVPSGLTDDTAAAVPTPVVEDTNTAEPVPAVPASPPLAVEPASEAAPEPAVAPAPAEEEPAVAAAPVDAPAEPAVVPEPQTVLAAAPTPAVASADPVQAPVSDNPVPEPATDLVPSAPAQQTVTEPVTTPPTIISIPVTDGGDSTDTAAPAAGTITVVEPPADTEQPESAVANIDVVDAPLTEAPAGQVADAPAATSEIDYTSPENFNTFQAPATVPDTTNSTDLDTTVTSPAAAGTSAIEITPQPAAPSVEIPTVITNPDTTPIAEISGNEVISEGPADPVPTPEDLDNFSAPIISAPDGVAVPEPEAAPAQAAETTTDEAQIKDDQLREVAADLAQSVSDETSTAAAPDASDVSRGRIVSPIPTDASKPTIHQLLAVEEAKNSAQQAATATEPARPNVDAYNLPVQPAPENTASEAESDPNSIAL